MQTHTDHPEQGAADRIQPVAERRSLPRLGGDSGRGRHQLTDDRPRLIPCPEHQTCSIAAMVIVSS